MTLQDVWKDETQDYLQGGKIESYGLLSTYYMPVCGALIIHRLNLRKLEQVFFASFFRKWNWRSVEFNTLAKVAQSVNGRVGDLTRLHSLQSPKASFLYTSQHPQFLSKTTPSIRKLRDPKANLEHLPTTANSNSLNLTFSVWTKMSDCNNPHPSDSSLPAYLYSSTKGNLLIPQGSEHETS